MTTVALLGTLDTKREEYLFLLALVQRHRCEAVVLDAGLYSNAEDDVRGAGARYVGPDALAEAGGSSRSALRDGADRGEALRVMAAGAGVVLADLVRDGSVDGVLAAGGSGATSLATAVFRKLPFGLPKVLVSTLAAVDIGRYVNGLDCAVINPVADVAGVNRLTGPVLTNAAAAACGMARTHRADPYPVASGAPLVCATMFGVTTPCVSAARAVLRDAGCEVVVFHANGSGGRAMEQLIASDMFVAALDVTTTELADEIVGGDLPAGPDRFTVAGRHGIPQVVSLGALDVVNFGRFDDVPSRFRHRTLVRHNADVTLMRTDAEEAGRIGAELGRRLSTATAPVAVAVPSDGFSSLSVPRGPFHDPEADAELVSALTAALASAQAKNVEVIELDGSINDEPVARAMAEKLLELCATSPKSLIR
ncbi:MAG: hypothetical protein QOG20_4267 [Pseudonocardiales bacterium]|jgi:uncharacterized protein (UPF0261 family)|nr:hypothetical protein [Pseudonocardiales bacterium]